MITIINNPVQEMLDICNTYNQNCSISFVYGLYEKEKGYAVTIFPKEEESYFPPQIFIDVTVPYIDIIELIAHEFAHIIAGKDQKHNKKWENVFNELNQKFNNLQEK